ncbi:E3 ubiquitin-protein ligase TRIM58-like isoform X2 [Nerophis ophidion]|uniref:E3 ubiquitin-protein ligase TRIM58-like isoform X2 n=1 Tax=Nerophis ophidion TaxID=159077 RepID=UPI002AE0433E|nr:E3 ubiquitin-protein ligase TRIM58-like isoform X2 [Nerophis ophidion]
MAHGRVVLDRDRFNCSVCLDVLKEPVTIPCGHSYCNDCIRSYWDRGDHPEVFKCPQCPRTFDRRPELCRNTLLADLLERLKQSGHLEALLGQSLAKRKDRAISQVMRRLLDKLNPDDQKLVQDELDSMKAKTRVYRMAFLAIEKKQLEDEKPRIEKKMIRDQKRLEKTKNKARESLEAFEEKLRKQERQAKKMVDTSQAKVNNTQEELDQIMKKLKDNDREYEDLVQDRLEVIRAWLENGMPHCSYQLGEGEAPRDQGLRDDAEPVPAKKAKDTF